jgi:hypothetical protein
MMKQLCVQDYIDLSRYYLFDAEQGSCHPVERSESELSHLKHVGFCSIRTLGLFPSAPEVVVVFCDDSMLFLFIGGKRYNLSAEGCYVRLRFLFPGVKRFTLYENGQNVLSFRYWIAADCGEGPGDGDIFSYVESVTENAQSKIAAVHVLQAR